MNDLEKEKAIEKIQIECTKNHRHLRSYEGFIWIQYKHKKAWYYLCPQCLEKAKKILEG